jgi:hypothetical protein
MSRHLHIPKMNFNVDQGPVSRHQKPNVMSRMASAFSAVNQLQ